MNLLQRFALQRTKPFLMNSLFERPISNMQRKLEGKVAVVTGSTAGIGFGIAEGLAKNGASVVLSSRKQQHVDDAVKRLADQGLSVSGIVSHAGHDEDRKSLIKKAIDEYGKLDILISNVGVSPFFGPLLETPESAWDKIFDINLKSGFLLTKEAIPHLKVTKGSILFVSSIVGFTPVTGIGAYSVSKTALLGLVKALAEECALFDVRVNCIAPGIIDTDFSSLLTQSPELLQRIPLRRFGQSIDCAGTAVFLSSEDASYVTGETIVVAGGMSSRL